MDLKLDFDGIRWRMWCGLTCVPEVTPNNASFPKKKKHEEKF